MWSVWIRQEASSQTLKHVSTEIWWGHRCGFQEIEGGNGIISALVIVCLIDLMGSLK